MEVKASARTANLKTKIQETEVIYCHHKVAALRAKILKMTDRFDVTMSEQNLHSTLGCGILKE
jgi:hypothetical protein